MDPEAAAHLRADILATGSAVLTTATGERLFLVHSSALATPGQGILLAYEGGGVFFWQYATDERPLNIYRLTAVGFPFPVSTAIMAILDGIDLARDMLTHV